MITPGKNMPHITPRLPMYSQGGGADAVKLPAAYGQDAAANPAGKVYVNIPRSVLNRGPLAAGLALAALCLAAGGCGDDKPAAAKVQPPQLVAGPGGKQVLKDSKGVSSLVDFTLNDWAIGCVANKDARRLKGITSWDYDKVHSVFGKGELMNDAGGKEYVFYRDAIVYVDQAGLSQVMSLWMEVTCVDEVNNTGILSVGLRGIEPLAATQQPSLKTTEKMSPHLKETLWRLGR
jgi:hypothetical protein